MTHRRTRRILITGGAGFVGSNLAQRLLENPAVEVHVYDNLSRRGVDQNLAALQRKATSSRLQFTQGDVRDATALARAAADVDEIYHLAAQVAVTTSVEDPRSDFDVNVLGTFNVLEAARRSGRRPFVLFTSTNKVYGSLSGVPIAAAGNRCQVQDPAFVGVDENEPLDFHSPYGCSKGAADQYVRDYARIYDLPTVVFRMSCIAGPGQFGTEDQGWVAHFVYSVLEGNPITIYGDGRQVRDVLHVDDLVDAMQVSLEQRSTTAGRIYNLGGGPERAVSIREMLQAIEEQTGSEPLLRYGGTRPGDQPLYISDTRKFGADTGWAPRRSLQQTLQSIHAFWKTHQDLLARQRDSVSMGSAPLGLRELAAEGVA